MVDFANIIEEILNTSDKKSAQANTDMAMEQHQKI